MYSLIYLSLLLAVAAMVEAYEQPAIGQITPAANPTNDAVDQSVDEEITPVLEDSTVIPLNLVDQRLQIQVRAARLWIISTLPRQTSQHH